MTVFKNVNFENFLIMKKLSDILPKVLRQRDMDVQGLASSILLEAETYLANIFGNENIGKGKNISATKWQHGMVFFAVHSSNWNQRLFLEKMELLEHLQKAFPKASIKDIRGVVAPLTEEQVFC
jgi:hypothetical protein